MIWNVDDFLNGHTMKACNFGNKLIIEQRWVWHQRVKNCCLYLLICICTAPSNNPCTWVLLISAFDYDNDQFVPCKTNNNCGALSTKLIFQNVAQPTMNGLFSNSHVKAILLAKCIACAGQKHHCPTVKIQTLAMLIFTVFFTAAMAGFCYM